MSVSYENAFENCAIYLPALSFGYARFAHGGAFRRPLPFTAQDLNFLDPESALFHYPWALFSAGQAAKSISENDPPTIVSKRDRSRTTVLARMNLPPKRRCRAPRRWAEGVDDLHDYCHSAPDCSSTVRRADECSPIVVTDDWPDRVPIGSDELRVIEGHLRKELDALFGPLP